MGLPLYLAMTRQEIHTDPLPERLAYMACHFSTYGNGLCHIPQELPRNSMLILNDRVPIWQHDPHLIARQLEDAARKLSCARVLLDLQRPGASYDALIGAVEDTLSCPVGISQAYASSHRLPVLVTPPPPNCSLQTHLDPWVNREIWLEVAAETRVITVTPQGAQTEDGPLLPLDEPAHQDSRLHCRYSIALSSRQAKFTINRDPEDVAALLAEAEKLGVALAVGLYQQLCP